MDSQDEKNHFKEAAKEAVQAIKTKRRDGF